MASLSVAALRLAALETLCPTEALLADSGYPTIAGRNVFDSRMTTIDDLVAGGPPTPAIGVYTEQTSGRRRGESQASHPQWLSVDLVLELEMAVVQKFDGETAVGNPSDDPQAELELDFLAATVRRLLTLHPSGALFRTICKSVSRVEVSPWRANDLGLRIARRTMVLTCDVDDDAWGDEAGLPEPLASLAAALPEDSYAKSTLDKLAAALAATDRTPLAEIRVGLDFTGTAPTTPEDGAVQARVDTTEE